MLQIGSGKLYISENVHANSLRGVIYTNLYLPEDTRIDTKAGSILSTESIAQPNTLVYEFKELIELPEQGIVPGLRASSTLSPYIMDFSVLLSFVLNCTASPSHALVERLLSSHHGISTQTIPSKVVKRVFDSEIYCKTEDIDFLIQFTEQIIGLQRHTYLGVMRAIRTYVTAMHRISDDFELAYTLLVASLESLAQDFDGHTSTWNDYDQKKRKIIDSALLEADEVVSRKVRQALLDIEHTSLGRRFREFTLKHINQSYYREDAEGALNPISRHDLPRALSTAYQARSQYIHNLKELPKQLTTIFHNSEIYEVKNSIWLSIQGLSRLARHVITNFVLKQKTILKEPYDYTWELYGVMGLKPAPSFWIANTNLYNGSGSHKLEGFLTQLAEIKKHSPNAQITNLNDILEEVEKKIYKSQLIKEDRLSYIALYILYNNFVAKNFRLKNFEQFSSDFKSELIKPSSEALITFCLLNIIPPWDIEIHHDCLLDYFETRNHKLRFRAPRIFEAGMILELAERYRVIEDIDTSVELIAMAVETYPENSQLKQFEKDFQKSFLPIEWGNILIAKPKDL